MPAIPIENASPRLQRFLEILSGSMSVVFLISLIFISWLSVTLTAYIFIAFTLAWLVKLTGYTSRLTRGYFKLRLSQKVDWEMRLSDLKDINRAIPRREKQAQRQTNWFARRAHEYYLSMLKQAQINKDILLNPDEIYHAVIVPTYNESPDILEPTIKSLITAKYNNDRMILFLGYEERGGPEVERNAIRLIKKYRKYFKYAEAIQHPSGIPGEVLGKGGNLTFAGRELTKYIKRQKIDPVKVVVTSLDSDHIPDPQYFAKLSYIYASTPDRTYASYQPIPMFFNNIWDAPALMRVIAASNSFWVLMESLRSHRLRNFASHAQSLQTLIDTDYWYVGSIVEDGHQYWRTYFRYHGKHKVLPVFLPIYQDAVLAEGYWQTFKAQFYQLRRWAWGVSDTPFVIIKSFQDKKIPWSDKGVRIFQQVEGYFSWATAPIVLAVGGWLPLLVNPDASQSILALRLPDIVSWIQTAALVGLLAPIASNLLSLPPRPPRHRRSRSFMMVLQWAFVPIAMIGFGSSAAINAQLHLAFGKYLNVFNVTEKKRVGEPLPTIEQT